MAIQVQGNGGAVAETETNTRANRVVLRPTDIGAQGAFRKAMRNGGALTSMAAGLAAGSPIYSFRWAPTATTLLALVRRIQMSANNGTTAFAAGISTFEGYVARSFTAADTGGTAATFTTNNAKLRTAFASSAIGNIMIATTGTMTAGTRTLDTDPFFSISVGTSATATSQLLTMTDVYAAPTGGWPLVLANQEGFVIQATVPATGTWNFTVAVDWEEVSSFGAATLT